LHKLTARFVETVKTNDTRQEFLDSGVRGLALRVSTGGAKTWNFRYQRNSDGRRRNVTLGRYPDYSLENARRWATELRAAVARGDDPAAEKRARRLAETFGQIAVEWVWRHGRPNKDRLTLRRDIRMLRRHVLPDLGAMKAGEIAKRDVLRMLDRVVAKPDARMEVVRKMTHQPNRCFQLVRSIFRWGVGRDLVQIDPTAGLRAPIAKEPVRERALSADEIRTAWLALDRTPISREHWRRQDGDFPMRRATALALKLALVTAQRIGEVTGICAAELDLNDVTPLWTVPGNRSKNRQPNRVPLSALALCVIAEARGLAGDSVWLFPGLSCSGPIEPTAPTKALARAMPIIGIPPFRVHDLRRTAATHIAEMGVAPHTISLVLNHVSVRRGTVTGRVYNQYSYDREKREALNA
jgi:integrase